MNNLPQLISDVKTFVAKTSPQVERISDFQWHPGEGFVCVLYRAIIRRQHDALRVICDLAERDCGYAASPLLRPACEELIWVKYLKTLDKATAEKLVACVSLGEVAGDLAAQEAFGGIEAMKHIGFQEHVVSEAEDSYRRALDSLESDAKPRGWGIDREKNELKAPSVWFLANETESLPLYNFLYHATSHFVHFRVNDLLRRAWGNPEGISIRSVHFSDYWTAFSLCWGSRLYALTLTELESAVGVSLDDAVFLEIAKKIADFGQVPIITPEELKWPETWENLSEEK